MYLTSYFKSNNKTKGNKKNEDENEDSFLVRLRIVFWWDGKNI